ALLNHPSPAFNVVTIEDPSQPVTQEIFTGQVSVLNVWATWCISCRNEHHFWMELSKKSDIRMIGLNYHDDLKDATSWLNAAGNPYHLTLFDEKGRVGMDYGVYGTPETFIID